MPEVAGTSARRARSGGRRRAAPRFEQRSFSPSSGSSGEAELLTGLADRLERFGRQAERQFAIDQARDQQAALGQAAEAGRLAGATTDFQRREGDDPITAEFNRQALIAHKAAIQSDIRLTVGRLASEHPDDPVTLNAKLEAARDGLLGTTDPLLRQIVEQDYAELGQRAVLRAKDASERQAKAEATAAILETTDSLSTTIENAARDGDMALVEYEMAQLGDTLAGLEDPVREAAIRTKVRDSFEQQLILGQFDRTPDADKAAFVDKFTKGKNPELDPTEKDRLTTRMQVEVDRLVREQDAAQKLVVKQIDDALARATKEINAGVEQSDEDQLNIVDLVRRGQAVGVDAETIESLQIAMRNQRVTRNILTMPLDVAEAAVNARKVEGAANLAQAEELEAASSALATLKTGLQGPDPTAFAQSQGIGAGVDPIDFSSVDTFRAGLASRDQAREAQESVYGQTFSPLTSAEADLLAATLSEQTTAVQLQYFAAVSDELGDNAYDVIEQLTPKLPGPVSVAAALEVDGAHDVALEIMAGVEQIAADTGAAPKSSDFAPVADEKLQTLYSEVGQAEHRSRIIDAAVAVYAAKNAASGFQAIRDGFHDQRFKDAIDSVTGGVVEWSGAAWFQRGVTSVIEAPFRGATRDDVDDWIESVTPQQIDAMGGVAGLDSKQATEDLKRWGQLVSMGQGRYAVRVGDSYWHMANPKGRDTMFVLEHPRRGR